MAEQKPEDIRVNIGGKEVPLSKINKPHHRVLDHNHILDHNQKPIPDPKTFPDVEPEAKEREAKLAEARKKAAEEAQNNA